MAMVDTADLISMTDAGRAGVSALARAAEEGREQIPLRNNEPVAAIVGMVRLEWLQRIEDDLLDVSLAAARMPPAGPRRHSPDDVRARFGYDRDRLRDLPE